MPPKNPLPRLREIRDAQKAASELTPERDRLIREAVEMNFSETAVAIATGLSQPRIHEIAIGGR